MNERIKELLKQAGGIGHDDDGNELTPALVGTSLEKFAELIVRECAGIAYEYDIPNLTGSGDFIGNRIMAHFGVDSTSIKVGSRVKVVSGFNVGAKGTVSYIEPTGRMWVMRDGASTDVFYTPDEVVRIEQ